jgi:hypothetical protein
MFDMDLLLESSAKTVKLIDFDTCSALGDLGEAVGFRGSHDVTMSHFFALDLVIKNRFSQFAKIAIFNQIPWRLLGNMAASSNSLGHVSCHCP